MKPHRSNYWLIPPKQNAKFVYRMEDVLALYHEPYDEDRPVICFDESSKTLHKHVRDPLPVRPGAVACEDTHYERNGKRKIHVVTEPLTGWRHVTVTPRRRKREFVEQLQELADEHYPDATCIRVVLDNLSTHNPAAFYEFCTPKEAREYLDRFEFHFTPVHGSWLNMAEIELSALRTQCLNRRIPDAATLRTEVAAWEQHRNKVPSAIEWQFSTTDARTKLRTLYPVSNDA
ncbi:IS630 family transposase [Haloterrigena turkmenica]|uniref:IS630 family transposase n=1 Tax=Haloterrigena turkmenica TaxID=62320 RepID=UPI001CF7AA43|nr:IS630 family transposase [Haloterrigena turkmenica]